MDIMLLVITAIRRFEEVTLCLPIFHSFGHKASCQVFDKFGLLCPGFVFLGEGFGGKCPC